MVTIKDIAKQAGVSFSTVSKALLDSPLVNKKTKERILDIAREMGYQPNIAARSLVSKKTGAIGMIWPTIERTALSSLITGLNHELEQQGYTTLLSISRFEAAIDTFRRYRVDAILIFGDRGDDLSQYAQTPGKDQIPMLVYGAAGSHPFSTVDVLRGQAVRLAVRHLAELGHRRIAYIGEPEQHDPLQAVKIEAFRDETAKLGLPVSRESVLRVGGLQLHDGYAAAQSMLGWDRPPTAVISGGIDLTQGILRAVHERKLNVPNDLSVVSYDNLPQMEHLDVPMTVVGPAIRTVASVIAGTLLELIEAPENVRTIYVEPDLVVRHSTAKHSEDR